METAMRLTRAFAFIILLGACLALSACGGGRAGRAASGGAIGAGVGAAGAAASGGSVLTGAVVGGAAGAAIGALTDRGDLDLDDLLDD
jgi:hypothetical protein